MDEIRRLMKEAKQKDSGHAAATRAAQRNAPSSKSKAVANAGAATGSKAKDPPAKQDAAASAIPVGFFDDTLADAKARKVDVQQLAEKQLETEWEAFQEFAAEVEEQTVKEEQEKQEESKEREAVEKLENMQYMDRYRLALERATSLRNGKSASKKRKLVETQPRADDAVDEGDGEEVTATVKQYKKNQKKAKAEAHSDSDDSNDFDPCNWRSRAI
ncbi:hypothetical protein BBJ28_00015446 [Nothophytophthora sp. Chile5]|nr:hypothetical protein BBJ28_00015446 [Nothophytophthora sp. Chile5]